MHEDADRVSGAVNMSTTLAAAIKRVLPHVQVDVSGASPPIAVDDAKVADVKAKGSIAVGVIACVQIVAFSDMDQSIVKSALATIRKRKLAVPNVILTAAEAFETDPK